MQLKYNKTDHKTHFISRANTYMFQHQGAINREFISNKSLYVQQVLQVPLKCLLHLQTFVAGKHPHDGTLVSKHVGVGTWYEVCFVICFTSL